MDYALCTQWEKCHGLYIMSVGWEYFSTHLAIKKLRRGLNIHRFVTCPKCSERPRDAA